MKITWLAAAAAALGVACSPGSGGSGASAGFGSGSGGAGSGSGAGPGSGAETGVGGTVSAGGDGFGATFGAGLTGNEPVSPDAGCKSVSQRAEKRLGGVADIVWAIDNSGSMLTEAAGVQDNMNKFSAFISGTGIDVHVVAVSAGGPPLFGLVPPYGICVAPPLGSGAACPNDTNPPLYTHVMQEVDSHNALAQFMGTFPQWQSVLRPDSVKTFVVVTDDSANVPADQFSAWAGQQFGTQWRFDAVACPTGSTSANCSGDGAVYQALVAQTGGLFADLGNPNLDWTALFQQLADAVVADAKPVDCEWAIPPPPDGETFDPNRVNVRFTPHASDPSVHETIYALDSVGECTADLGGWYFDDAINPTKVLACPSSCTKMQASDDAQVDVIFGCARERPPIQ